MIVAAALGCTGTAANGERQHSWKDPALLSKLSSAAQIVGFFGKDGRPRFGARVNFCPKEGITGIEGYSRLSGDCELIGWMSLAQQ